MGILPGQADRCPHVLAVSCFGGLVFVEIAAEECVGVSWQLSIPVFRESEAAVVASVGACSPGAPGTRMSECCAATVEIRCL